MFQNYTPFHLYHNENTCEIAPPTVDEHVLRLTFALVKLHGRSIMVKVQRCHIALACYVHSVGQNEHLFISLIC